MERNEFIQIRKSLGKTQRQLASLLDVSLRTIHSYEQGLRGVPARIQKDLYFFLFNQSNKSHSFQSLQPCWEQKCCTNKEHCPAWEFKSGMMCWYINGTLCAGKRPSTYEEKLLTCKSCNIFKSSGLLIETYPKRTLTRHSFIQAQFY